MAHVVSAAGRVALAGAFSAVPRAFVSPRVHGLEHDPAAPRTIYAITHKRDLDAIAPLPALLAHRGLRGLTHDVKFAMRGDSFHSGFLARVVARPEWFARLVRPLSLATILRGIGILPLDALYFRPAEMWLRDEAERDGGVQAREVLSPALLEYLAQMTGDSALTLGDRPLASLMAWRYFRALQESTGPEVLVGEARHRAERGALARAKGQLEACADWLRAGGSLYTSPEGYLSPDGHISALRAGLYRILRAAPADTLVVPVAIVYDFMTAGRVRMHIDLAPPLAGGAAMPPQELERALRGAWLQAARFTCTQIASGIVMAAHEKGGEPFTAGALARDVLSWARRLSLAGRNVAPDLLRSHGALRTTRRYVRYAERHGALARDGSTGRWKLAEPLPPLEGRPNAPGYASSPLRYAWNELQDMLEPERARPMRPVRQSPDDRRRA